MTDFSALLHAEVKENTSRSEWAGKLGGQEVTLYSGPLTPSDNHQVLRKYPDFNTSMNMAGMAMYIALKAEDADGKKAFIVGKDLPLLMRMGQNKIGEIFAGLFGDQIEDIDPDNEGHEDRVKN